MKTRRKEEERSCSKGEFAQAQAGHVWKMINERHLHETKVSNSLKLRKGLHRFIGVFIIRSTISQVSKHTSCYSLAFALLHVLKNKKVTIGKKIP